MRCAACKTQWDVGDGDPPACAPVDAPAAAVAAPMTLSEWRRKLGILKGAETRQRLLMQQVPYMNITEAAKQEKYKAARAAEDALTAHYDAKPRY